MLVELLLLLVQNLSLNLDTIHRSNIFALYQKYLAGVGQVKFISTNLKEVSPWFIDVLIPDPLALQNYLKSKNIGSRVFYPAIHTQPVYKHIKGNFPVAVKVAKHGLWLPSSAFLKKADIQYICSCIKEFYKANQPYTYSKIPERGVEGRE